MADEPMSTVRWAVRSLLADPATPELHDVDDIAGRLFLPDSRGALLVGFAVIKLRDEGAIRYSQDVGWGLPCKYAERGCPNPEWRGQPEHNRGCCPECGAEA